MKTPIQEVYENFNFLSDADFKSWMLNTDLLKIERERMYDFTEGWSNSGLTIEDYNIMFKKQNGCCAICNKHILELNQKKKKHLCIDHNHDTGAIRGLLCDKCNRGIGLLQDDKEILLNAYNYLCKF